jgi:arylsulfatase A-like enzyme
MISNPKHAARPSGTGDRLRPLDLVVLSAWCGLAAGELEVVARVLRASLSSTNRLYLMTRHFGWVVPLVHGLVFLGVGIVCAAAARLWPRRAGWLGPRIILTLAIVPALVIAGPVIYPGAWLILAMGTASLVAPVLERHASGMRRWLTRSLPLLLGAVLIQATVIVGEDHLKQRREETRPLPPAGSPNVLLIVLDTVRADRLSLYGYDRATSPALLRLAAHGIRFERARAAAPWTLASHATVFTGRWSHELAVGWMRPLCRNVPTLAEFLGDFGYATAGFVGNTLYCSYDSGLNRGFTHYEDYVLGELGTVRTSQVVELALRTFGPIAPALGLGWTWRQLTIGDRKEAGVINREFLDWLSTRREPRRPFFAFLNYVDAHAPYVLPPGVVYRFGVGPRAETDFLFLLEGWLQFDKQRISTAGRTLARDSYDNCLAYLDDRLGELFDELRRRGVLDQTLVIVTADHGEGLGEHGLFDHGESLYRTEIHVPLVIVPPAGHRSPAVVGESVSLRDLPATIAELVAPEAKSPFPGRSLSRFWRDTSPTPSTPRTGDPVLSELLAPNPIDPNRGRSPAHRGPLISLAEGDYVYIRNEGDGAEELFDEREDTHELINRAGAPSMLPVLRRFRDQFDQLKADHSIATGS